MGEPEQAGGGVAPPPLLPLERELSLAVVAWRRAVRRLEDIREQDDEGMAIFPGTRLGAQKEAARRAQEVRRLATEYEAIAAEVGLL